MLLIWFATFFGFLFVFELITRLLPSLGFSESFSKFSFSNKALYASYYNSTINALATVCVSTLSLFECPDGTLYTADSCTYHWGRLSLFA